MGKFTQFKTIVLNQIRNSVLVVLLTVFSFITVQAQTTVADVVINSESHTTLEAAVIAAGLAETLSGEGPFTVFAPTDAAFAALPAGTVEALLADAEGALKDILLYHVLGSKVMSTDLSNGMSATTLLGKDITVTINENGVFINGAQVTVADIETDNGVVHVIDAVLVPAAERTTVVDVVVNSESHTTLEAAVIAAGLAETLSGDGPFTVFAPTDAAFAALPAGTVEALLADAKGALKDILLYHVLGSKVMSTDLSNGMSATTLLGRDITVTINENGVFINGAQVTVADIETDNGVVHVIDAVLVPSPTTNVGDDLRTNTTFTVYPNPAVSNVAVDFGTMDLTRNAMLRIIRMDGSIMKTISVQSTRVDIALDSFVQGMYMVVLENGNKRYTEKLIVK